MQRYYFNIGDLLSIESLGKLFSEIHISQFALHVSSPIMIALLHHQVIKVQRVDVHGVGHARHVDDAPFIAGFDLSHKEFGEQEVAEVVDSNLLLKALLGLFPLR